MHVNLGTKISGYFSWTIFVDTYSCKGFHYKIVLIKRGLLKYQNQTQILIWIRQSLRTVSLTECLIHSIIYVLISQTNCAPGLLDIYVYIITLCKIYRSCRRKIETKLLMETTNSCTLFITFRSNFTFGWMNVIRFTKI
jgi:hypothetical protein